MNGERQPDGPGASPAPDVVPAAGAAEGRNGGEAWTVAVDGEEATRALAARLGGIVGPRAVIVLEGDLGAGKTTFVKGLAQGMGIDPDDVSSPTFTLIHEYEGDVPLYHFDAYRLADAQEFIELGAEEYFSGHGVTAVEWGGRVRDELPPERLDIAITAGDAAGGTRRRITFRPLGAEAAGWVAALRQAWEEERARLASDGT